MNSRANNIIEIVKENKIFVDIYLSDLGIKKIPIELLECTWLKTINLESNRITEIPHEISLLQNLECIKLSGNLIKKIPRELVFLPKLTRLEIEYNPLIEPPIEVVHQGINAIRNYFLQLETEKTKIYEAKLLIVGEGFVGKSTLMHRILYNKFNKEITTTEGIEIRTLKVDIADIDFKFIQADGKELVVKIPKTRRIPERHYIQLLCLGTLDQLRNHFF